MLIWGPQGVVVRACWFGDLHMVDWACWFGDLRWSGHVGLGTSAGRDVGLSNLWVHQNGYRHLHLSHLLTGNSVHFCSGV